MTSSEWLEKGMIVDEGGEGEGVGMTVVEVFIDVLLGAGVGVTVVEVFIDVLLGAGVGITVVEVVFVERQAPTVLNVITYLFLSLSAYLM